MVRRVGCLVHNINKIISRLVDLCATHGAALSPHKLSRACRRQTFQVARVQMVAVGLRAAHIVTASPQLRRVGCLVHNVNTIVYQGGTHTDSVESPAAHYV